MKREVERDRLVIPHDPSRSSGTSHMKSSPRMAAFRFIMRRTGRQSRKARPSSRLDTFAYPGRQHLCYGDPRHKACPSSRKTFQLASPFTTVSQIYSIEAWTGIHMPVPRAGRMTPIFAPLKGLTTSASTEIYLGLVHLTDGIEGTRKRLQTARRHLTGFGIATECGFGRRDPATVEELLDIHRASRAKVECNGKLDRRSWR